MMKEKMEEAGRLWDKVLEWARSKNCCIELRNNSGLSWTEHGIYGWRISFKHEDKWIVVTTPLQCVHLAPHLPAFKGCFEEHIKIQEARIAESIAILKAIL